MTLAAPTFIAKQPKFDLRGQRLRYNTIWRRLLAATEGNSYLDAFGDQVASVKCRRVWNAVTL